jgi:integrase
MERKTANLLINPSARAMQEALRQVTQLEDPHAPLLKPIGEAIDAYKHHIAPLETGTRARYGRVLKHLLAYSEGAALRYLSDINIEDLDRYRSPRALAPTTSAKELVILRQFFSFSVEQGWIAENPAKKIKPPRNVKPKEVIPYEPNEITRMLAACDAFGRSSYERLRARAMLLLLRYTGLRISDAATLAGDRIKNGQIFLRTKKTGGLVFLPIPQALEEALAALPPPRGAERVRGTTSGTETRGGASSSPCPRRCGRLSSAAGSRALARTASATRWRRICWRGAIPKPTWPTC